jgi:phosphatidylglycerol---prolipoprotein diacylglyceryl transferase
MFPVIDLGPFVIQAPGLILFISLWMGFWLMGKFSDALGTNGEALENGVLLGILMGIISARIGFLLQHPTVLLENPRVLFSLSPAMINTSFGLLVGLLSTFIYSQKKHLPLWPSLDTTTPLIILVFTGWHLANFANGDAFGLPTELPWGVELWNALRHPVQIYILILTLCLSAWFIVQTKMLKTNGFLRSGLLFQWLVVSLAFITLFTQAFVQEKMLIADIDLVQAISFLILLGDFILIYWRHYKPRQQLSVYISLGSNIQPKDNLSAAIVLLKNAYNIRGQSSIYQSPDITRSTDTLMFNNQVVEILTDDRYPLLQKKLKSIEHDLFREPGNKQRVPIDLDILTYDKDVFTYKGKHIPHPNLTRYHYITQPLAEISPEFRHPATGKSIQDISSRINNDPSALEKIER